MILYLRDTVASSRYVLSFSLAAVLCLFAAEAVVANVRYVGDILPVPDPNEDDGSSIQNQDVLVGNSGAGGIFIDFTTTLSNPPTFEPLPVISTTGNIGVLRDGVGRVEITDNAWSFTSSNDDAFIVGDEGYGLLDVFTSGLVDVTNGGLVVGDDITGQGAITINTIASRLLTNSMVIGDEGLGSVLLTDTSSVVSTVSNLGREFTGQGSITMNDATRWDLRDQLTIGDAGIGDVVLNATSNVISVPAAVDPNAVVIGRASTGQGTLTLNESSRFFTTGGIVVGENGFGTVTLNGTSTLITGEETAGTGDSTIGRGDGSTGHVTLYENSRWDVRGDLGIGRTSTGDPNGAVATLNINDSAYVQVPTLSDLTVGRRGEINMGGGTLNKVPFQGGSSMPIENFGIIRGKGTIRGLININDSGELRNGADVANQREVLLVTSNVTVDGDQDGVYDTTDGLIESIGGEMEFHGLVTNNGVIVMDDAIMRFRGSEIGNSPEDLINDGVIFMGRGSNLYGNISSSTGNIIIDLTTGAQVNPVTQVFGDLVFVPSIVAAITEGEEEEVEFEALLSGSVGGLSFTVDNDPSVFTVLGDIILDAGRTIFDFTYSSDVPSQAGDTFTLATASNIVGEFFNSQVEADGFLWDVDILGNDIVVTNTGNLTTGILGDFNGDGRVDNADFMAWQRDPSIGDLADWTANYGSPVTSNVTNVPEPSTFLMTLAFLTSRLRRRSR